MNSPFYPTKAAILLVLLNISITGFSQNPDPTAFIRSVAPSPEAAQISRYGIYPVGNFTGLPDISLPVYEIKLSDFSMPLSLSYFAGGIKVDDFASSVGLGWSLNAGGVITRTVVGVPDEQAQKGILDIGIKDESELTYQDYDFCLNVLNQDLDSEPDIFSYNVNGHSGKFSILPNGKIITIPFKNDIKIEFDRVNFTLTDAKGYKYLFAKKNVSTFMSIPDGSIKYWPVTSWYLTAVYNVNGLEVLRLEYLDGEPISSRSFDYSYNLNWYGDVPIQGGQSTSIHNFTNSYVSAITFRNGRINFKYQSGRLDYGSYILDSILIVNQFADTVKKFKLRHDYFYSNIGSNPHAFSQDFYRLKLTGFDELNTKGGANQTYTFEYNNVTLPPRKNFGVDLWGYYNGKHNNTTLFMPDKSQYYIGNGKYQYMTLGAVYIGDTADRKHDEFFAKAGMLKKITYPTGGSTEFIFDSHRFESIIDVYQPYSYSAFAKIDDVPGDPLRQVTFTSTYSGTAPLVLNIPLYNSANDPYAVFEDITPNATSYARYTTFPGEQTFRTVYVSLVAGHQYRLTSHVKPNPNDPNEDPDHKSVSINISYKTSTRQSASVPGGGLRIDSIINYDVNRNVIGQQIYKYGLNENGMGTISYSPYYLDQRNIERTSSLSLPQDCILNKFTTLTLMSKPWFSYSDIGGSNVFYTHVSKYENSYDSTFLKSSYEFDFSPDERIELPLSHYDQLFYINNTWKSGNLLKHAVYKIGAGGQYNLIEETEHLYHKFEISNARGLKIGRKVWANDELQSNYPPCYFDQIFYYNNYPIVQGVCVPKLSIKRESNNGGDTIISETNYEYANLAHALPTAVVSKKSDGGETKVITKYNSDFEGITSGNEISTGVKNFARKHINQPVEKSIYLIKQDSSKYLISSSFFQPDTSGVYYKKYLKVNNAVPLQNFSQSSVNVGALQLDSRYDQDVIVDLVDQYGNVLQQRKANNVTYSYLWGYNYSYPVAEIVGADYNTVAALVTPGILQNPTSDLQLTTELNKVRQALPNTQITTFTYKPLIGMISSMDDRGLLNYYEYDGLGRFKVVKDHYSKILKQIDYQYKVPVQQ